MQSLNRHTTSSFDPSDIERHVRRARAMRSEAANRMIKSTLQSGSKMIRGFLTSTDRRIKI